MSALQYHRRLVIGTAYQDVSRHQRRFSQAQPRVRPSSPPPNLLPLQPVIVELCRGPADVGRGDLSHVTTLATKLRELNNKVSDVQREQRYMREVEATFRDASESTNTRAVWWSLGQIGVLIAAGIWQMRHLKVGSPPSYRRDLVRRVPDWTRCISRARN